MADRRGEDVNEKALHGRRELLRASLYAGFAAACGGLVTAGCSGDGEDPGAGGQKGNEKQQPTADDPAGPQVTLDLSQPDYQALRQPGGAARVAVEDEKYPLIVFRASESNVTALSARCTHQGCQVQMPKNGRIRCPCHASTFSITGEQLSGPAPSPLPGFPAEVRDGAIVVRGVTRPA